MRPGAARQHQSDDMRCSLANPDARTSARHCPLTAAARRRRRRPLADSDSSRERKRHKKDKKEKKEKKEKHKVWVWLLGCCDSAALKRDARRHHRAAATLRLPCSLSSPYPAATALPAPH